MIDLDDIEATPVIGISDIRQRIIDEKIDKISQYVEEMRTSQGSGRVKFKEDVIESIVKNIERVVNGKIDRIQKSLDIHIQRVEPVIKSFENNEVFKNEGKKYIKGVGITAGAIGSMYIIREFLIKIIK